MNRNEILEWLRCENGDRLEQLRQKADQTRRKYVGDAVHLRGIVEVSNYCRRDCLYCGIRASRSIERYRMSEEEIVDSCRLAVRLGYGTVVLQSGEDPGLTEEFISRLIRRIKTETGLAVTLSLGERRVEELAAWRRAGADRYLLKHETSDARLFEQIHPGSTLRERVGLLTAAREIGYEIGSGVMVGIPGQSFESLADDILLFHELDLDMVGCGPYVSHPQTPLGNAAQVSRGVPNSGLMTAKVIALVRLVCPDANIPTTTALATVNPEQGRELGLRAGANVWMPNLTPERYRQLYDIYPGKAKVVDDAMQHHDNLLAVLMRLGRHPGKGAGDRRRVFRMSGKKGKDEKNSACGTGDCALDVGRDTERPGEQL